MSRTPGIGGTILISALGAVALSGVPAQAFNVDKLMNPGNWMGTNTDWYEAPPPDYGRGYGGEPGYYDPPGYGSGYPGYGSGYPDYGPLYPNYGGYYPDYGSGYPGYGSGYPDYTSGYPGYDNSYPGYGTGYPGYDSGTAYGSGYPGYEAHRQGYGSSAPVYPTPAADPAGSAPMPTEELIYHLQQRIQELEQALRHCR